VEIPPVKSYAAWNEKGLYFSCEINDKLHYQMASGKNIWKGDGIQIRLGVPQKDQDKIIFLNFGLTVRNGKPYAFCYEDVNALKKISYHAERKQNITKYDIFIPGNVLQTEMRENIRIPFSFVVNMHDGKIYQGWLQWTGGVCGPQDPRLLGELILQK
jgi:hypothetical protein